MTTDDVEPANDMPQSSSDVLDALACVVDTNDVVDTNVENTYDVVDCGEEHPGVVGPSQESLNCTTKRSRECYLKDNSLNRPFCHTEPVRYQETKLDLKNSKTEAARYMQSSFGEMLDDEGFLNWLSSAVGYKLNRLKKILSEDLPNRRNSAKLPPSCHQEIYSFWLEKSITSTDSTNSLKRIPKKTFLQNYKDIVDTNLREEVVQLEMELKSGTLLLK